MKQKTPLQTSIERKKNKISEIEKLLETYTKHDVDKITSSVRLIIFLLNEIREDEQLLTVEREGLISEFASALVFCGWNTEDARLYAENHIDQKYGTDETASGTTTD